VASPFSNVVRKKLTDIFQDKTVWTHTKKLQIGSGILKLWAVKVSGASFFSPAWILIQFSRALCIGGVA